MTENMKVVLFTIMYWILAPLVAIVFVGYSVDPLYWGQYLRDMVNMAHTPELIIAVAVYLVVFMATLWHGLRENVFNHSTLEAVGYLLLVVILSNIILLLTVVAIVGVGETQRRFAQFLLGLNTPR